MTRTTRISRTRWRSAASNGWSSRASRVGLAGVAEAGVEGSGEAISQALYEKALGSVGERKGIGTNLWGCGAASAETWRKEGVFGRGWDGLGVGSERVEV